MSINSFSFLKFNSINNNNIYAFEFSGSLFKT